jgi:hypothetical protein
MKRFLRPALKGLLGFFIFLFFLPFLISPIYNFPEPKPFAGDKIWNPYQNIDSANWHKGNFQIQSLAWGGLTDGSKNPTDSIVALYDKLQYDVIGISDYMKINTYLQGQPNYIPIYEHGYNIRKTHQVSIGAKKVFWLDFPLYQTTSQKQFIINQLQPKTDLLAIVHPAFSLEGYSHNDLKYLVNYDLLEALNHQLYSISHWDAALSNGHAKYILANDDAHDISNPFLVGVVATFINAPTNNAADIIAALRAGKSYGYLPYTPDYDNYTKKVKRLKDFPTLLSAQLTENNYELVVDKKAIKIDFIGQDGKIKKTVKNSTKASYLFLPEDSYIRVEIDFDQGEKMFLNPIFRYSGTNSLQEGKVSINWGKSIISYLLSWTAMIFILIRLFGKTKN